MLDRRCPAACIGRPAEQHEREAAMPAREVAGLGKIDPGAVDVGGAGSHGANPSV